MRGLEDDGRRAERGASSASRAIDGLNKNAKGTSQFVADVGKKVALASAAAGVAAGALVTKGLGEFMRFERGMNEVFTLIPGISEEAMGQMSADVRQLSSDMGVLPDQTIPALYQSLSAGVPPDNVFDFLETATKASIGGTVELETAVDGITSVVNSYGGEVINAAQTSDIMFTAVRLGKTTFGEMADSMFQVVPTAEALGVGFDQVGASVATLTAKGVPTSIVMTQMRSALTELADTSTGVGKTFNELTGQSFKDFIEEGGNVGEAMQLLADYADDADLDVNQLFSRVEAGNFALGLTGEGAEAFAANLEEMANSAGATDAAFDQMDQGIGRTLDRLNAKWHVALGKLGEAFAPFITKGLNVVIRLLDRFSDAIDKNLVPLLNTMASIVQDDVVPAIEEMVDEAEVIVDTIRDWIDEHPEIIDLLETTARVAGIVVGGWIALSLATTLLAGGMSILGSVIGFLLSPMFLLIAALTALGVAYETNFLGFRDAVADVADTIGDLFNSIKSTVEEAVNAFKTGGLSGLGEFIKDKILGALDSLKDAVSNVDWNAVKDKILGALGTALALALSAGSWVTDNILTPLKDKLIAAMPQIDWVAVKDSLLDALGTALALALSAGSWVMDNILTPLKDKLIAAMPEIDWAAVKDSLLDGLGVALALALSAGSWVTDNILTPLKDKFVTAVSEVDWSQVGTDILNAIGNALQEGFDFANWIYENYLLPFKDNAKAAIENVDWEQVGADIVNAIGDALQAGFDFISWIVDSIFSPATENSEAAAEGHDWSGIATTIMNAIGTAISGFIDFVVWVGDTIILPMIRGAVNAILNANWNGVAEWIFNAIGDAIKGVIDFLIWVKDHIIVPLLNGAISAVSSVDWGGLPTAIFNAIKNALPDIGQWVEANIIGPISSKLSSFNPMNLISGGGGGDISTSTPTSAAEVNALIAGQATGGLMPLTSGLRAVNERGLEGFVDPSGTFRYLRTPQSGRVVGNHQLQAVPSGSGNGGGGVVDRQPIVLTLDGRVIFETVVEYQRRQS